MIRILSLFLVLLLCTASAATALAAAKRPADPWIYYHFDGIGFKPGPSPDNKPFVAVRERVRPVLLVNQTAPLETIALPEGSGAISGICYIQSAGGKLDNNSGYDPCPRQPLLISSGGRQLVTVQTDENGYFVVVLPAGTYAIGSGPFAAEIPVERGISSLVPLRAGKRMVD